MLKINPVVVFPTHIIRNDNYSKIALLKARQFLSQFRLVILIPESIDWEIEGFETIKFPDSCFGTIQKYNQLKLSLNLYKKFSNHTHMLIYQFDALVFKNELEYWCQREFDYIGASWYPEKIKKYVGFHWPYAKIGCGNGGLSLRKLSTFISHIENRITIKNAIFKNIKKGKFKNAFLIWIYQKHLDIKNYVQHESLNEDVYFGIFAPMFDDTFSVATPEEGNLFSFEYDPNFLLEKTKNKIPFGCHAWHRFPDAFKFWSLILEKSSNIEIKLLIKNIQNES
jgi:hypothetical protein